jgi:signal peptide peptidase SppA
MNERTCAQQHFGPWAIEPRWMEQAVQSVKSGTWKAVAPTYQKETFDGTVTKPLYEIQNGVAVIPIEDQITKHQSSFGGTSSVVTRKAIRAAVNDRDVTSIMLHIDSPGGTVSGTADLGWEVRRAKSAKPVHAYIEDMGASAAYWIAVQADRVTCNDTAMVGSIGVYTVLADTTGAQEMDGIKLQTVSSGGIKGAGADGRVTPELIDDVQREIDSLNERFLAAVADGRGMDIEAVRAWNDGRVFVGSEAVALGMVDAVETLDEAILNLTNKGNTMNGETFAKYAAENPDAAEVKALIQQGYKAGKAEGIADAREQIKSLADAIPNRADFVISQFAKGNDVTGAKAELADVLIAEMAAAKTAPTAPKVDVSPGHAGAIPVAKPDVAAADISECPKDDEKAAAAWLWENKADVRDRFVSETVLAHAIKRGTYQIS